MCSSNPKQACRALEVWVVWVLKKGTDVNNQLDLLFHYTGDEIQMFRTMLNILLKAVFISVFLVIYINKDSIRCGRKVSSIK